MSFRFTSLMLSVFAEDVLFARLVGMFFSLCSKNCLHTRFENTSSGVQCIANLRERPRTRLENTSSSAFGHQLAFFTPGICPLYANSRKQILQIPYFFKTACGRPQILQRVYALVENLGLRCCLIFNDVLAMNLPPLFCKWHIKQSQQFTCFFIRLCGCNADNIHTPYFVHLIILNFREDKLFLDSQ